MSVESLRTITCLRCGTVVPWAPHCPHCSAYLEFHGEPPWLPDSEPESVHFVGPRIQAEEPGETSADATPAEPNELEPPAADAAPEAAAADVVAVEAVPEATVPDTSQFDYLFVPEESEPPAATSIEGTEDSQAESAAEQSPPSVWARYRLGWRAHPKRQLHGYLSAIGLAVVVDLVLVFFIGWLALWALPVFVLWALFVVARFGTLADGDEYEPPVVELAEAEPIVDDGPVLIWLDDDAMAARAPQTVAPVMERSTPISTGPTVVRDVECSECQRMNISGHRFCDRCGAVLEGATVAPPVVAVSAAAREEEERAARQKERRVSGSWRSPIFFLALGLALVGALVFAFLGPGALQTRIGLTTVFQVIAQFIDPYSGSTARVETLVASSTLPGTDASQAGLSDTQTFWASAPSAGYGVGTTLAVKFTGDFEINRLVIYPGIQNNQFDLRAVATPKQISLGFDDGSTKTATLEPLDSPGDRRQLVEFPAVTTTNVTLTIDSVYPPRGMSEDGFGEVAISGMEFLETPKPPAVFQVQKGGIRAPVLPGAPQAN